MHSVVSVVVQYSPDNDKIIRELLAKLWAAGVSAELYDKVLLALFSSFSLYNCLYNQDDLGEDYFFNQNINFFVEFLNKCDKKSHGDNRIVVKKNDCKGVGLEQISADDTKTTTRVVELILKESRKTKDTFISRFDRDK